MRTRTTPSVTAAIVVAAVAGAGGAGCPVPQPFIGAPCGAAADDAPCAGGYACVDGRCVPNAGAGAGEGEGEGEGGGEGEGEGEGEGGGEGEGEGDAPLGVPPQAWSTTVVIDPGDTATVALRVTDADADAGEAFVFVVDDRGDASEAFFEGDELVVTSSVDTEVAWHVTDADDNRGDGVVLVVVADAGIDYETRFTGDSGQPGFQLAANWTGGVPDSLLRGYVPRDKFPLIAASLAEAPRALLIANGARLDIALAEAVPIVSITSGGAIAGAFTPVLSVNGTNSTIAGELPSLDVDGVVQLGGPVVASGRLDLVGTLSVGDGDSLIVDDALSVEQTGVLTQQGGRILVEGAASFDGTEPSVLSDGTLVVRGALQMLAAAHFEAEGNHVVRLEGAGEHDVFVVDDNAIDRAHAADLVVASGTGVIEDDGAAAFLQVTDTLTIESGTRIDGGTLFARDIAVRAGGELDLLLVDLDEDGVVVNDGDWTALTLRLNGLRELPDVPLFDVTLMPNSRVTLPLDGDGGPVVVEGQLNFAPGGRLDYGARTVVVAGHCDHRGAAMIMRDENARLELEGGATIYDLNGGSAGDCDAGTVVVRSDLTLFDVNQQNVDAENGSPRTLCSGTHVWRFEGPGRDVLVTRAIAVHFGNVTVAAGSALTLANGGSAGSFGVDGTLIIEGQLTVAGSLQANRVEFVGAGGATCTGAATFSVGAGGCAPAGDPRCVVPCQP